LLALLAAFVVANADIVSSSDAVDALVAEDPYGKTPKGKTPKSKTPKGKTPKGKTPKGKTPKGKTPKTPKNPGKTPKNPGKTPKNPGNNPKNPGNNPSSGGKWSGKGVDVSSPCSNWPCLKQSGYSFAVVRIFQETDQVDPHGLASVKAAQAAGLEVDVYMYPAGKKSGTGSAQAQKVVDALKGVKVGRVWIDVEGTTASWSSDTTANSKLFTDIVDKLKSAGHNIGVYTQGWQWAAIMGAHFDGGKAYPVWYAEYGSQKKTTTSDGTCDFTGSAQNLNSFKPFGGWTSAYAKQYNGNCMKCGCGIDVNVA